MAKAKLARKVEISKRLSFCLRLHAPHFYPDICTSGSVRGVDVLLYGNDLTAFFFL